MMPRIKPFKSKLPPPPRPTVPHRRPKKGVIDYPTRAALVDAFVAGDERAGRCGSASFRDNVLWSYAVPICILNVDAAGYLRATVVNRKISWTTQALTRLLIDRLKVALIRVENAPSIWTPTTPL